MATSWTKRYAGRMRTLIMLPFVSVVACGGTFEIDTKQQTCSEDIFSWSGGLTRHVLQGDGTGVFDYDPATPGHLRVEGSNDFETGAFNYVLTWEEGFVRSVERFEGQGMLWLDGDMDIEYSHTIERTDGSSEVLTVREQRFGCEVSVQRISESGTSYMYGTYDANGLQVQREYPVGANLIVTTGRQNKDGSYEERVQDFEGDRYKLNYSETGTTSGDAARSFVDVFEDVSIEGEWTRGAAGTTSYTYAVSGGGYDESWDFVLDLAGTGVGTVDIGGTVCDLEVEAFACERKRCGELRGSCDFPLLAPRF